MSTTNKTAGNNFTVACDLYWAKLDKLDDFTGKYGVTLANLSERAVAKMDELGVTAKFNEKYPEQGMFFKVGSKFEINAVDEDNRPIKGFIGNGSKARVTLKTRDWTFQRKTGITADITRLVITELVDANAAKDGAEEEVF